MITSLSLTSKPTQKEYIGFQVFLILVSLLVSYSLYSMVSNRLLLFLILELYLSYFLRVKSMVVCGSLST